MNFFNKYKNLFEVPSGITVPQTPLQLDNHLFVEKVYQPTFHQEYALNNKLRQLKKDYQQFETEINDVPTVKKTPHRTHSRKGKDVNSNETSRINDSKQKEGRKMGSMKGADWDIGRQKQKLHKDSMKRQQWFKSQNNNILKHSQIDFIFNNKINHVYQLQDIKTNTLPIQQYQKPPQLYHQSPKQYHSPQHPKQQFHSKQRSSNKPLQIVNKNDKEDSLKDRKGKSSQGAIKRRQKAKQTIQYRRKKLQQLLKTLW